MDLGNFIWQTANAGCYFSASNGRAIETDLTHIKLTLAFREEGNGKKGESKQEQEMELGEERQRRNGEYAASCCSPLV